MSDRARLEEFLLALRGVCLLLLEYRQELLPEHLWDLTRNAWPPAEDAIATLRSELMNPVDPAALEAQLSLVGLTGVSLDFKLGGFNAVIGPEVPQGRQSAEWFDRAFGWATVVLGSLSRVLPSADLLKEFKDAGEQGLRDMD